MAKRLVAMACQKKLMNENGKIFSPSDQHGMCAWAKMREKDICSTSQLIIIRWIELAAKTCYSIAETQQQLNGKKKFCQSHDMIYMRKSLKWVMKLISLSFSFRWQNYLHRNWRFSVGDGSGDDKCCRCNKQVNEGLYSGVNLFEYVIQCQVLHHLSTESALCLRTVAIVNNECTEQRIMMHIARQKQIFAPFIVRKERKDGPDNAVHTLHTS